MSTKILAIPPGLGFTKGTLARWRVGEGDLLGKMTVLCELESDKACFEWPVRCPDCRVEKLMVREGDEVEVGTAIAEISLPGTIEELVRDDPWRVPEED